MARKNISSRRKHFTITALLPTGDVLRITDENQIKEHDGIMIFGARKGSTDTDRRLMQENQYIMRYSDFKNSLLGQIGLTGAYDNIALRDAASESSQQSALSFVRNASSDPEVGRAVWAFYIYDQANYILLATQDDVRYFTDLSDSTKTSIDTGNFIGGITEVSELRGKSFSRIFDQMLFVTNPSSSALSAVLTSINPPTGTIESGTTFDWDVNAVFDPGSITNGDGSPGPNLVGDAIRYIFTNPDDSLSAPIAAISNSQAYTAPAFKIAVESVSMAVDVDYGEGTGEYTDSSGNPSTVLDDERVAGNEIDDINAGFTGRLYAFYDVSTFPSDSGTVRAAASRIFLSASSTGTFDITIPAGQKEVWFSVPAGKTIQVLYVESSNADVTGEFAADTFDVINGGGSGDPVSYDTWKSTIPGIGYPETATYKVTIS